MDKKNSRNWTRVSLFPRRSVRPRRQVGKKKQKIFSLRPGFEPGSSAWQAEMLTSYTNGDCFVIKLQFFPCYTVNKQLITAALFREFESIWKAEKQATLFLLLEWSLRAAQKEGAVQAA